MIKLYKPYDGECVSIHTGEQKAFIDNELERASVNENQAFKWDALVCCGCDRSIPKPVAFSWNKQNIPVTIFISDDADFKNARSYFISEYISEYEVYNLNIGVTYHWYIENTEEKSSVFSFYISDETPRNIYIEGVTNIRDIGGYKTTSGRRIRQNMVYRGSEFDSHMNITGNGITAFQKDLHIKTDLDMRAEVKGILMESLLYSYGIEWKLIPLCPYDEIFTLEDKNQYGIFFKEFTDINRYPIYYHCWGGADRTGTFSFLLGALLGMKIEDLILDYEWTSLSIWGIRTRNYGKFQNFIKILNEYESENDCIQNKVENYIMSAGLTGNDINIIRDILLE